MSGHLIGCVKPIQDLGASQKLALTAFADSADDRTHIGFPGYEGVQEWAVVSRARAAELIRDLVQLGYLKPHKRGRRGQRAEYIVFPDGCCELHRTPVEEPGVDAAQLAAAAGVTVDQIHAVLTALASDAPDPVSVNGSDVPDPNPQIEPIGSEPSDANPGKGPERVHGSRSNPDAFTPSSTTSPHPPPASRQGRCPAHPNGRANCRMCGTTPRQLAAAAAKQAAVVAAEERRTAQFEARAAATAARAEAAAATPAGAAAAREALAQARRQRDAR